MKVLVENTLRLLNLLIISLLLVSFHSDFMHKCLSRIFGIYWPGATPSILELKELETD